MENTQQMSLGRRLQRERESHHWTQEQLAERIHGSVASINRWERDKVKISLDALKALNEVFGKPPEQWGIRRHPLWNVPYLRNQLFTGRKQELERLHKVLAAENTLALTGIRAITGMGGIGKTQTALEYAYRYADEYEAVLWVQAETHEILTSDFARLTTTLDLREKNESDQFRMISAVKRWLQAHVPWLLIFDNADDLTMVSDFLPRQTGGAILLTTRSQIVVPPVKKIELGRLSREEGISFLLRRIAASEDENLLHAVSDEEQQEQQERHAAEDLWEAMDGLPLALDQAGAYIEAKQSTLSDYLNLYRTQRNALHQKRGEIIPAHPDAVATTWSLSFQRVRQRNAAAAELLQFCAFLSPDAIDEELLSTGGAHISPALHTLAISPLLLNEAISTLRDYSLIQRDAKKRLLSMHRLVQAVLQDTLGEAERYTWTTHVVEAINAAFPIWEHAYEQQQRCEQLLPHALLAAHYIKQEHIISEEAAHLLHNIAYYLHSRGRYTESEPFYHRALALRQGVINQTPTLRLRQHLLEPEHLDIAETYYCLAVLYCDQGRYTEAEPLYQRVLALREQQLEPSHPDIARTLNGLAYLYTNMSKHSNQARYDEAEALYLRSISIYEQSEHPDRATPLNNLAMLYFNHGKYAQAEPLYQRALTIYEQTLGSHHRTTALPINNLANIYALQGRYDEAESLFQQALHIWQEELGTVHPLIATAMCNLAELAGLRGNYVEAEPLYLHALSIYEQAWGQQHPEVAETLCDLARVQEAQGNAEAAKTYYTRAQSIREQMNTGE